jgi:hypothetical protein
MPSNEACKVTVMHCHICASMHKKSISHLLLSIAKDNKMNVVGFFFTVSLLLCFSYG